MNVVMVKHPPKSKIYWFEVPDKFVDDIHRGVPVLCDTVRGRQYGVAVSGVLDSEDVRELMAAGGATTPLRQIVDVAVWYKLSRIKIPPRMANSIPSDDKLAERFLEYHHNGEFYTRVVISEPDGTLKDGYTAYLAANTLSLDYIHAFVRFATNPEGTADD